MLALQVMGREDTISVEDALEQMPIPGPNCDDNRYGNPYGGRCRCTYEAILDFSNQDSRREAAGCSGPLILMVVAVVVAAVVVVAG